jgi:transcriptional regulator with XRE-family HTH domain
MSMTAAQAKQLGTLIAKARARKGLSYRALALQLGVAYGWLAELEMGRFLDPAPDRLARLAEALDIEPARIDRITKGSMADSLPEVRTYFRAKYGLSPEQSEQIERYVERYIDPPEEQAA